MLILALETATDLASCALLNNQTLTFTDCPRTDGAHGQHSATLLPAVSRLLAETEVTFAQLDAIAFDMGPGAFTGLRMGCALAQGLAVARQKPLLPIGSLEAMAWSVYQSGGVAGRPVIALLDARMGEVYRAAYRVDEAGVHLQGDIQLGLPESVPLDIANGVYCGNALAAYPALAQRVTELGGSMVEEVFPHAAAIARLAGLAWQKGESLAPALAAPRYVRDKVAKTIAERLAEGGRA